MSCAESRKVTLRKALITSNDHNADKEGNNKDEEEENKDVEVVVGDSVMGKVDDNNIVFRAFMKCVQEERHHKNNDINNNASVAMQTSDQNFFTNYKPNLSNASRMMDQIVELNPHVDLKRETMPASVALKFFRFL